MAKTTETIVTITDDLDGSEGAETVLFGFEGAQYEIDLVKKNRDKMAKALEPYLNAARKASSSDVRRTRRSGKTAGVMAPAMRAWAKEQGLEVPDRGRVPIAVQEAYVKAHN